MNILLPALFLFLASMGTAASQEHETQRFDYYVHDWRVPGHFEPIYKIQNHHRAPWTYEAGPRCFEWDINYLNSIGLNIPEYRELNSEIVQLGGSNFQKTHWDYWTVYTDGTKLEETIGYTHDEVEIIATSIDDFVYAQKIRIDSYQFTDPMWCDGMYIGG